MLWDTLFNFIIWGHVITGHYLAPSGLKAGFYQFAKQAKSVWDNADFSHSILV